jgi:4-hydroxy-4-methyl-2-oxoglutarate aldolase
MSADVEVTHALLELGAATLGETGARAMRARIHAAWPGARLAAPAFPVHCTTGDNLAIHTAVARAEAGDALVVDVGEFRELGYWGEVLTTAAQARGLTGLVIDGGVRDITEIQAHGFPVFSTMIALRGATKNRSGSIWSSIQCGGVLVEPGDWVVGDADGVVVVPGATLADVINAGRVRAAKEAAMFRALWDGKTTLDLLELDRSPIKEGDET